ncbi:MAG: pH regulation protein F [Thiomicrospira sp.]|nr:pH regulation protein F [Thiomicrospira sp.]PIQ04076.1 MAG: pH regulation protein F [Piscirickettsiaceae bacterium CG18_big_fil_WC_8_21_14_2_50_44_103]PIU39020.1 MAG: pH regulation protein F [Piscirickettsiaceae bacterium CG07_land_8_20_14_0_80_44_28]PIW56897.1 MAG: pH regulation protein F [Piscirickettsiaceae bacterium CG12_big_fil_rev_8_21_14_0_65_44_934]PIW78249.1 MAG: pH regulation protein F [Piscirickettsiaceae bacterium CG_4_8_14_3_um_filter_44_38]PIY76883.1 MAG: pH regulation protein
MMLFYQVMMGVLLLCIVLGLVQLVWGHNSADRLMAVQLLGTIGVAILLLAAQAYEAPSLRDVALVLALLAAVTGVAFVRLRPDKEDRKP